MVVVDADLVWQTTLARWVQPRVSQEVPALGGVMAALTAGDSDRDDPALVVVGPTTSAEAVDPGALAEAMVAWRRVRPRLEVVLVVEGAAPTFVAAAQEAGVLDVLDATADPDELQDALGATLEVALGGGAAGARIAGGRTAPGRLIVVTSAKGGEGVTTVAVNLAVAAAAEGQGTVVLVDGDQRFGDVALFLGLAPPPLGDGFDGLDGDGPAVLDLLVTHAPSGLAVLVPPRSTRPTAEVDPTRLLGVLSALQAVAATVVVDAPLVLVERADLLTYASELVLVSDLDAASLKNSMVAVQILVRAGAADELVDLVVNRAPGNEEEGPSGFGPEEAGRLVGVPVVAVLPDDPEASEHQAAGQPLVLARPSSAFATGIRALVTRLVPARGAAGGG